MNIVKIMMMVVLMLTLISCKKDMTDLDAYFKDAKLTPAKPIEPLPEINSPEVFLYDADGLRDPFSNDLQLLNDPNLNAVNIPDGDGPDLNRRKELLENYPLDSLFMVGTYLQDGDYWGLIEDPESDIHRVSVSEHMGQNYGEITEISEDEVIVSEWVSDGLGGWTKRQASIALREE